MTNIEWTDETWNPIVGCTVTSKGCTHCYAMPMAARLEAMHATTGNTPQYEGTTKKVNGKAVWTGKIGIAGDKIWEEPLRRKKPTRYFVNSMGDLFHPNVPDAAIDRAFAVMALAPQHIFQVLTKHPERMRAWFEGDSRDAMNAIAGTMMDWTDMPEADWPLPNVWLGTSVEDLPPADARIPLLLDTPAAVRFISAEPLLGPVNLNHVKFFDKPTPSGGHEAGWESVLNGKRFDIWSDGDIGGFPKLDWVIVGGESGKDARPMHPDWARALRDQCAAADVPFFFKQFGEWLPWDQFDGAGIQDDAEQTRFPTREWDLNSNWMDVGRPMWMSDIDGDECVGRVGKKAAGRTLDGVIHDGFPMGAPS